MNPADYSLDMPLIHFDVVTVDDVTVAIHDLTTSSLYQDADAYLILRNDSLEDSYIQARWSSYRNAWQVEYQAGSLDQHFVVFEPVEEKLIELFTSWMPHPESIGEQANWRQIDLTVETYNARFKEFKQALFKTASKYWEKQGRRNRWFLRSGEVIYSLEFKKQGSRFLPLLSFGFTSDLDESTSSFTTSYMLRLNNLYPRFQHQLKVKYPGNPLFLFDPFLVQIEMQDLYPNMLNLEKRTQDFETIFEALTEILSPFDSQQAIENNQDEELIRAGLKFYVTGQG